MDKKIKDNALAVLTAGTILSGAAYAGFFDPQLSYYPELTMMRVGTMAAATGAGFLLGWLLSPRASWLRTTALMTGAGAIALKAVLDNGETGWFLTSVVSAVGFSAALGYWLRPAFNRFWDVPDTHGSSRWATVDHLQSNGAIGMSGFQLGYIQAEGKAKPIHYKGDRHLLTCAPNRSGKGVTMIVPNLLTYKGSAIVIDPKGENAMITSERRAADGQEVHIVDPWGIALLPGQQASRFNPLDWLVAGDPDIGENAMLLADAIAARDGEADPFWHEEAKAFLQGVILYVATDPDEAGNRNLGRVRDLLLLDGEDMQAFFRQMLDSDHRIVASTGARSLQKEPKVLASVIASAQAQTHFLDSPRIRESLSVSDFSFDDLKSRQVTVYLVLPADRLDTFGRWLRLLIQQAITVNTRNIAKAPVRPILFMLDEMAALGRLAMIEQAFGLMAGFGIQIWGIVQDFNQLERIYGKGWQTFVSNAGVVQYFGSRDQLTSEYFSALCGVTTVWSFSTAVARTFGKSGAQSNSSDSSTSTTAAVQRKLAYPDELMRMNSSQQLLLIENLDPIRARRIEWFRNPHLKSLGRNLRPAPQPVAAPAAVSEAPAAAAAK